MITLVWIAHANTTLAGDLPVQKVDGTVADADSGETQRQNCGGRTGLGRGSGTGRQDLGKGTVRIDFKQQVWFFEQDFADVQAAAEERKEAGTDDDAADGQALGKGAVSTTGNPNLIQFNPVPAR